MRRALEVGLQTREGESRMGQLALDFTKPPIEHLSCGLKQVSNQWICSSIGREVSAAFDVADGTGTLHLRHWKGPVSGPRLLLLHGGSGSWLHWIRNVEVLSKHYDVWTLDLPRLAGLLIKSDPTMSSLLSPD